MESFETKLALVTGASSGNGAAISKELVKCGMTVIGAARRFDRLKDIENELQSEKGTFIPYKCDLTIIKEIYELFAFIKKYHGGVYVCVNNAGSILQTSLIDGNPEEWKDLFNLNVIAACLCSQLTIKSLQDRNIDEGHIFNISSIAGHKVFPVGFSHFYSATKFALSAMSTGFRQELKNLGSKIKVTEIAPSLTNTELIEKMPFGKEILKSDKINPLLPEDIAASVVFSLSLPPRAEIHELFIAPTNDC